VHAAVHHAALVIQHSSGGLITRCVAFAEEQITGLQLVERSGVEYQAQSFGSIGSAMCQLDREPATVPPGCFGSGPYWQYFHRQGAGWHASVVGASSSALHDGDMDGWRYAVGANQAPGNVSFAAVCSAPPPSAAATRAAATGSTRPAPAPATPVATSTPVASPSPMALAPSAAPSPQAVLASTGPPPQPPTPSGIGRWLAFAGTMILLLGLGALNLRRRGP
jgi:hypothetical protein